MLFLTWFSLHLSLHETCNGISVFWFSLGISKSTSIFSGAMLKKMENEKGIVARFVIGKRYPCIIVVHVFVIYFLSVLLSTIMDHDENIKNGFPCSLAVQIPGTIWIVVLTMKTGSLMTSSFLYVHEICGDFRMPSFYDSYSYSSPL